MSTSVNPDFDAQDGACLERIAVGMAAQVPDVAIDRLIAAGLVRRPEHRLADAPALELTPAGLARIRSSDQ